MTYRVSELVIAGWTGRDQAALHKHIRELEEIGVKPPKTTPIFYRVAASLLTTAGEIEVSGPDTSGEAEFVLVKTDSELRIAVGSDHAGFELKEKVKTFLENHGAQVADHGTHGCAPVDLPDGVDDAVQGRGA